MNGELFKAAASHMCTEGMGLTDAVRAYDFCGCPEQGEKPPST